MTPRIRMYRQGLGDCFLLSLPGPQRDLFHMLIDCGVHSGTPDEKAVMNRLARDIEAATGGRLDVVVVTHDHWDSVSGFVQARSVFDRIKIGEVWMAWTEDPSDTVADSLRQSRSLAVRGLRVMAGRLDALDGASTSAAADRLRIPLGFFGLAAGAGPRAAVDYLKEHPSQPRVRYLRPGGAAVRVPDAGAIRVYRERLGSARRRVHASGGAVRRRRRPSRRRRRNGRVVSGVRRALPP
jgi:hypothetical protein